jgi:RNA polymerase sigma-70 factor (ECF subfamily)
MAMAEPKAGSVPRTDAELVEAAQRGDAAAMETLLARFESPIYRFGLRMCRDPEDAREVLQETWLAAAQNLGGFRGDAAVGTWLYAIARSFCLKLRHKHGRGGFGGDGGDDEAVNVPDPAAWPEEAAADHEIGEALQRAVAELSRPYREVLVLRDVEGLTAPEVAAALGIGVDAVKSRLHRARVAVREKIAPLLEPGPPAPTPEPESGCPDVLDLFSRRLEGEVDVELCHRMERHLAGCPRCAAACDSLKRTLALCSASSGAPVPPRVQESVRRAVREMLRYEG